MYIPQNLYLRDFTVVFCVLKKRVFATRARPRQFRQGDAPACAGLQTKTPGEARLRPLISTGAGTSIFQELKPRIVLHQTKRRFQVFDESTVAMMDDDDECDVQICRLMKPDDANIAGNVHGGTILKMIEEAGIIASTRHCNNPSYQDQYEKSASALVRVETTDFLQPMYIGELAELRGKVTYTGPHSVEVKVMVTAENLLKGTKRLTNFATLWYVPMSADVKGKVLSAPPLTYKSKECEEEGRRRYEAQKTDRRRVGLGGRPSLLIKSKDNEEKEGSSDQQSVSYSSSSLIHLIGPSDCNAFGYATGGVTMKLMDEVAGCVAARHCRTNIVTASMDATNFHKTVKLGSLCHLTGRATFTSNRSLEIEVMVDAEYLMDGSNVTERAVHAFFTYVSLGPDGKTLPIPKLKVQTEGEKKRFEEGKLRYEQRKSKRFANKKKNASTP